MGKGGGEETGRHPWRAPHSSKTQEEPGARVRVGRGQSVTTAVGDWEQGCLGRQGDQTSRTKWPTPKNAGKKREWFRLIEDFPLHLAQAL